MLFSKEIGATWIWLSLVLLVVNPIDGMSTTRPSTATAPASKVEVLLPYGSPPDIPQIELQFVQLGEDKKITPFPKSAASFDFILTREDGKWDAGYGVYGNAIRLAAGPKQELRQLLVGASYTLRVGNLIATFSVPKVEKGEVEPITVLLHPKEAPAAQEDQYPPIRGKVKGLPADHTWFADYGYARNGRFSSTAVKIDADGNFLFKNAPLGGELIIGFFSHHGKERHVSTLYYISQVNKSNIVLPDDATYFADPAKRVDVKLTWDPAKLPKSADSISIYLTEKSSSPLLRCWGVKHYNRIQCQLIPGAYTVRLRYYSIATSRSSSQEKVLLKRMQIGAAGATVDLTSKK